MVRSAVAIILLLASVAATASQVEDFLNPACALLGQPELEDEFCKYQYDGGTYGDATDACDSANKTFAANDPESSGVLVYVDDEVDHYHFTVASAATLTTTVEPSAFAMAMNIELKVALFNEDCTTRLADGEVQGDGSIVASASVAAGTYALRIELGEPQVAPGTDLDHIISVDGMPALERHLDALLAGHFQCDPRCPAQIGSGGYPIIGYGFGGAA